MKNVHMSVSVSFPLLALNTFLIVCTVGCYTLFDHRVTCVCSSTVKINSDYYINIIGFFIEDFLLC